MKNPTLLLHLFQIRFRFQIVKMGKLSKILLKTFVFGVVCAQDESTFQVTSCNAAVSF